MRLFLLSAIPLSLSGCFGLDYFGGYGTPDDSAVLESDGDTDADADSDTDTDTDADSDTQTGTPPEIIGVDPAYGSTAGGTNVTIVGGPFDGSTTVTFGGATAAILSSSSGTLEVRTPSIAAEDTVDVVVTTAGGSDTDSFTYFEDGAGLAAAVGEVTYVEYLGGYWNNAVPFGFANWSLVVPINFHYYDFFAPSADTCRSEYQSTAQIYVYDFGISSTRLRSGSRTLNLAWDATALAWSADLTSADISAGSSLSLLPMSGEPLDGLTIDPFTTLPSSPNLTSPNLSGTSLGVLSQNQLNFSWSAGGADYIVIQLGLTNPAGDSFVEWVTCRVNNDGSFNVPAGSFNSWISGRYVYVYFGAVKEGTTTVATNGGVGRVAGVVYKLGAARTQ